MIKVELLFWCVLVGTCYSYFLYPAVLLLMPKRKKNEPHRGVEFPLLTLIITAHNEENRIREKILNTLALDYPRELLEILVASDASTDATEDIVEGFFQQGVRLVRAEERKGKEYAQLQAIKSAKGEILIFSDVATGIDKGALKLIAERFSDEKIGAISSEDRFISEDGSIAGEGAYVKYEMWLRKLESEVYSLVGLSGSFFAARSCICKEWDISIPSDFNTALNCARQGYIAVTDREIIGYYKDIKNKKGEYARKLRTVIRGISAVMHKPDVLNPFKYGFFAFEVWSHKIMRWMVPWFLLALFVASVLLSAVHPVYTVILILQILFYGLVFVGAIVPGLRQNPIIKIPFYFIEVNIAIAHAMVAYILGKRITVWTPSKR
ncbi:Glycosyl transferase, group 2 family [hydrothermal vent metagenome]|uniref:Glycosyl transferase, group 2 family n=1 Tax=hydrothermal vent metagenome TaxID=652676 RepID=A0A3B1B551_9ZZZZ